MRSVIAVDDMSDAQLDALLPAAAREASRVYWTPVGVARRAAQIFAGLGVCRVLDVGSGPGKFCVVASAQAPRVAFVGIEHRAQLVAAARSLAATVGSEGVTFVLGDATSLPWTGFDAFYVFNSFAENAASSGDQFDHTVELSRARRVADVIRVERWLAAVPVGTVLLTYNGLGGPIPASYACLHVEAAGDAWLRVWRRVGAVATNKYWLEDGADVSVITSDDVGRCLF